MMEKSIMSMRSIADTTAVPRWIWKLVQGGVFAFLLGIGAHAHAWMEIVEEAAESYRWEKSSYGKIRVKQCPQCDWIEVWIGPKSRISLNGRIISINDLPSEGRGGLIFYDPETFHVTRANLHEKDD